MKTLSKRKLGIIIQARTGSTRLPKKILMPINGIPLILHVFYKLKTHYNIPIIIATSDNILDDEFAELLIKEKIDFYRGSEFNVLNRFIHTANNYRITDIIRVCADNPFLDLDYLDRLIEIWDNDIESDYISFKFQEKAVILTHFGIFAEIVKLSALEKVEDMSSSNKIFIEHVTNGVYTDSKKFKINLINIDKELLPYDGIRLTIDTKEDLDRVSQLLNNSKNIKFNEIANYILSEPHLLDSMRKTINNQKK